MAFTLGEWRGRRVVLGRPSGGARLWLDSEGELCDRYGRVTLYDPDVVVDLDELASWVADRIERCGIVVGYADLHPAIRRDVAELIPPFVEKRSRRTYSAIPIR